LGNQDPAAAANWVGAKPPESIAVIRLGNAATDGVTGLSLHGGSGMSLKAAGGGMSLTAEGGVMSLTADVGGIRIGSARGKAGFFGANPAVQPELTYSRNGETPQQAQMRAALAALGLISDKTTA
jgi:hypothetical protein